MLEGFNLSLNSLKEIANNGRANDKVDISEHINAVSRILGVSLEDIMKDVIRRWSEDTYASENPEQRCSGCGGLLGPDGQCQGVGTPSHAGSPGEVCQGCGGIIGPDGQCSGTGSGDGNSNGKIGSVCSGCGGIVGADGSCSTGGTPNLFTRLPGMQNGQKPLSKKEADSATLDFITSTAEIEDYEKFLDKAKEDLSFLSKQI
jgi:hypothetical protein